MPLSIAFVAIVLSEFMWIDFVNVAFFYGRVTLLRVPPNMLLAFKCLCFKLLAFGFELLSAFQLRICRCRGGRS